MDKEILRARSLQILSGLSPVALEDIKQGLTKQLHHFFQLNPQLTVSTGGAYLPMKNEVLADFNELKNHFSLTLSYPVKTDDSMCFGLSAHPQGRAWLSDFEKVVTPAWLLIPGLAFSLKGERLGRGGGYYDRYLAHNIPLRIALTYSGLICENIPVKDHDALMDFIITESFCWDVRQQKRI